MGPFFQCGSSSGATAAFLHTFVNHRVAKPMGVRSTGVLSSSGRARSASMDHTCSHTFNVTEPALTRQYSRHQQQSLSEPSLSVLWQRSPTWRWYAAQSGVWKRVRRICLQATTTMMYRHGCVKLHWRGVRWWCIDFRGHDSWRPYQVKKASMMLRSRVNSFSSVRKPRPISAPAFNSCASLPPAAVTQGGRDDSTIALSRTACLQASARVHSCKCGTVSVRCSLTAALPSTSYGRGARTGATAPCCQSAWTRTRTRGTLPAQRWGRRPASWAYGTQEKSFSRSDTACVIRRG